MADDAAIFDQVDDWLKLGPESAVARLCDALRERGDFSKLFHVLLLGARLRLGMNLNIADSPTELPRDLQSAYENEVRESARKVGSLCLEASNIPEAWTFFRMIGEPGPVAAAIEDLDLLPDGDIERITEIAFHESVSPRRGFDLILDRLGICSAVTAVGNPSYPLDRAVHEHAIGRLVTALHAELMSSLRAAIQQGGDHVDELGTIPALIDGRSWLFGPESYHVDLSHLTAIVRMSIHAHAPSVLMLAIELCEYGKRLHRELRNASEPPFDRLFEDVSVYLSALAGIDVSSGIEHFRRKLAAAPSDDTRPAEALVNLLVRVDMTPAAIEIARTHLANRDPRFLGCPSLDQLCFSAAQFAVLAEVAKGRSDLVQYLAAQLAARSA